jgi:hypothetical protein
VITQPLIDNEKINPVGPNGVLIAEEASRYILPTPRLKAHQRIQIYNQQYWWRLLNTLHDNFPLVTRLFGYHAFNEEIGIPYLTQYPPNHWSLTTLGEKLTEWITESYHAPDQQLILNAAQLDWAFTASFIAPQKANLNLEQIIQEGVEGMLSHIFYLQPHIYLFKWDYDLLTFREIFIQKDVAYWTKNNFPPLAKGRSYHFVLSRSLKNNIIWKEISAGEYALLYLLKKGSTLENACQFLQDQETSLYEHVVNHLQKWFQDWVQRHWLTLERPE